MGRRIGRLGSVLLVVLAAGYSWCIAEENIGSAPWAWEEDELKKIASTEKKLKKDEKGYWTREKGEYIVKTNISPRFTAELCLYMDFFFKAFPKIFVVPAAGDMKVRLRVFIHRTRAQYLRASGAPPWSGGVHKASFGGGWPILEVHAFPWREPKDREIDFCKDFNRGVLQHEGAHAMFRKYSGRNRIPVFFNEGCATYFEAWNLRVTTPTKKERQERFLRGFHLRALQAKCRQNPDYKPDLQQCLNFDSASWGTGEISLHYALAESFADFLLSTKKGRKTFREMVEATYKRVSRKIAVKQLLEPKQVKKLEPAWHEHIKKLMAELPEGRARGQAPSLSEEELAALPPEVRKQVLKELGRNVRTKGEPKSEEPPSEPAAKSLDELSKDDFNERVSQKVDLRFRKKTPLSQVLAELTKVSRLPFTMAEDLEREPKIIINVEKTPVKAIVSKLQKLTRLKCIKREGALHFGKGK